MKRLIFFIAIMLIATTILTLCTKKMTGEKMNAETLKAKYAIILPDLQYEGDEYPGAAAGNNGKKKQLASAVIFTVFENSLPITISGTTMASIAPINTDFFGGQLFIDSTTINGAAGIWDCNRYFNPPLSSEIPINCETIGPGFYRFFSTDFLKNVYLSRFQFNP